MAYALLWVDFIRWFSQDETLPTPIVIIDQESDPNATVVELSFGDRLGALLDTVMFFKNLILEHCFLFCLRFSMSILVPHSHMRVKGTALFQLFKYDGKTLFLVSKVCKIYKFTLCSSKFCI